MDELNGQLLSVIRAIDAQAPTTASLSTAYRWMRLLGFKRVSCSKGYYTDSHNRDDVVQYRDNDFLPRMKEYETHFVTYDSNGNDILPEGDLVYVLITHDECTVYCNEQKSHYWTANGKKIMKNKSKGVSVMVSGFACPCHGFMQSNGRSSYLLFEAGKHREGWFTNDMLVQQYQECLPLIQQFHTSKKLLFAFDNSMSHHKRPPDGLDASLLPLKDNGKNVPIMRQTNFLNNEQILVPQNMQNDLGQPKGIKTILMERGKWREGMLLVCRDCTNHTPHENRVDTGHSRTTSCCARYCLSEESDFKNQKEWLREVVETSGSEIIFYPKFHCELNFIEMLWSQLKSKLRSEPQKNVNQLKQTISQILEGLDSVSIKRSFEHCLRFMSGYREGLQGPLLDFAVKKYASHRRINATILDELEKLYAAKHT